MSGPRTVPASTPGTSGAHEPEDRSSTERRLKQLGQWVARAWTAPRLLAYRCSVTVLGRERAFRAASEAIAGAAGTFGVYRRQAFYRQTLARCGEDIHFGWMSVFSKPQAAVESRAYIGRGCSIGLATIGSGAMLADGVQVLSGRHQHRMTVGDVDTHRKRQGRFVRVEIGRGAWLGANAIVMADIGVGAVVGAGAVVVDPVPPRTVVAGVPARPVRRLDPPNGGGDDR